MNVILLCFLNFLVYVIRMFWCRYILVEYFVTFWIRCVCFSCDFDQYLSCVFHSCVFEFCVSKFCWLLSFVCVIPWIPCWLHYHGYHVDCITMDTMLIALPWIPCSFYCDVTVNAAVLLAVSILGVLYHCVSDMKKKP